MDELFGEGLFMTMMIIIVVGLVAAAAFWMFRRSAGRGENEVVGGRSKQQRLGVLEELIVDKRRSLILVRRDNAEHLIMVGGPSDIVIEANIARGPHLQAVRSEPVRDEAPSPPPAREAREPREAQAEPKPRGPREKPLRAADESQQPAAQGSSRRQAQDRSAGEPPPRRSETGLAAAANALELALRKPFGGGGERPERPERGASRQAPPQVAAEALDADDDRDLADSAVTPFPAPAARGRDDGPYDLDAPMGAPPPPAAMPRFLSGGNAGPRRGDGPVRPAAASGEGRDRGERDRDTGPRPTPFPSPARTPRPAPPSAAPGVRERPSFGSPRPGAGGGSPDLVASRSERPAPLSLEDEMASLLDEISGVRERG